MKVTVVPMMRYAAFAENTANTTTLPQEKAPTMIFVGAFLVMVHAIIIP